MLRMLRMLSTQSPAGTLYALQKKSVGLIATGQWSYISHKVGDHSKERLFTPQDCSAVASAHRAQKSPPPLGACQSIWLHSRETHKARVDGANWPCREYLRLTEANDGGEPWAMMDNKDARKLPIGVLSNESFSSFL